MMIPGIGMNLYLYIELFYMSYFLTDVCNFSLGMTTLILTSTAAVDLVWVFVTGVMIEKAQFKKLGKYRAWYVIMPPIITVFFTIMFFDAGNSNLAAAVIIMAFCLKTLAQDVVSAAVTGHISQMTDDPDERTLMNARRNQGSIIGQLLFSLIGLPVISWIGVASGNTAFGYTGAAFLFCIACMIAHFIVFMITKDAPIAETEKVGAGDRLSMSTLTAMFTDTVVYYEWKTGKDARGFIMSMLNVPIKIGALLRGVVLSAGLAAAGYVADQAVYTTETIKGVSAVMNLYPAAFLAACTVIVALGYRLSDQKIHQMTEEIAARKGK